MSDMPHIEIYSEALHFSDRREFAQQVEKYYSSIYQLVMQMLDHPSILTKSENHRLPT